MEESTGRGLLPTRFDHHLAQADSLRCLFSALNDETFEVPWRLTPDQGASNYPNWPVDQAKPCLRDAVYEKNSHPALD